MLKKFSVYYKPYIGIIILDLLCASLTTLCELVFPLIYAAVARHERADFLFPFLYALWQEATYSGYFRLRKIWEYLRIDKQNPFYRITHNGPF